jgi:hypothetical protein
LIEKGLIGLEIGLIFSHDVQGHVVIKIVNGALVDKGIDFGSFDTWIFGKHTKVYQRERLRFRSLRKILGKSRGYIIDYLLVSLVWELINKALELREDNIHSLSLSSLD